MNLLTALNFSPSRFGNAAWNRFKFIQKNRKIRFGLVPHIDKEFFGTGIKERINSRVFAMLNVHFTLNLFNANF